MRTLIALCLTLAAGTALAAPTTVVPKKDNAAPGRKIFDAKCAACHGKTGTGSPAMARMFKVSPDLMDLTGVTAGKLSVDAMKKVVMDGRNKMPSFKGKLKPADVDEVVAYVRTLQKPLSGPPGNSPK